MAINDDCERLWRIYKITFKSDGYAYVGMTVQPVPDRIQAHLRIPVNAELTNRLRKGLPYEYETLHEMRVGGTDGEGLKAVYALEQQEIHKLEKPLNIYGINPKAKRLATFWGHEQTDTRQRKRKRRKQKRCVHPPREGIYACSICGEQKPHTEFDIDKGRFNGLDSRCKPCRKFQSRRGMTSDEVRQFIAGGGVIENPQRFCFDNLPEVTKKALIKDYEAGMTYQELEKKHGINFNTIRSNFIKMGIQTRTRWESRELNKLRKSSDHDHREALMRQQKCSRKRSKKRWTNKEIERLRELVIAGKTDVEIASLIGRSKNAVLQKRKNALGIDIRKHWTDAEDARLKKLLTTTDKSLSEIGKLMGRGRGSIERRKEKLGIRRVPFKLDRFNPSHVAQLLKFKMAGWTQEQIAEVWGLKNPCQISAVLRSHGFPRFRACIGEKGYQKWGEAETHLLRKYLKRGMSRSKIHREFPHRSPSSINSKARKITKYWLSPAEQAERQQLRANHMRWRVY